MSLGRNETYAGNHQAMYNRPITTKFKIWKKCKAYRVVRFDSRPQVVGRKPVIWLLERSRVVRLLSNPRGRGRVPVILHR